MKIGADKLMGQSTPELSTRFHKYGYVAFSWICLNSGSVK